MTAIGVTTYGGPEALHELDVPSEPLGASDVRIRVTAAAVSPTDTGVRSGQRDDKPAAAPPGAVPGMDAAGEVVELGADVDTGLAVGDRVMAVVVPSGPHGAYRSDLVVPAASVTRVPAGASDAEASTLPMNSLTARFAIDSLQLQPGQVLAVTGAAGAFGGYVVQLAKADGLVVVADAAEKDHDLVEQLGADVILPRGDGFVDAVLERYPDGVDGLADGAVLNERALPAVKDGGRMATVRGWDGGDQSRVTVLPVFVREHALDHDALDRLRQQVEDGVVTLRVADTVPAAEAGEAHRRLEAGGVRGRLVLTF
ncbi:NADP-dependent oxidoreductase [Jatrophihabitans endophyticus]|uniref:NADP-dependent oxidoreductase n=1 Tax=Jatrophihabitans endophyticus TaxID=1206085 RepID=UPI0019FD5CF4|nr:NADP-dependent oxidoreductase [Jatrophihabitans endophyticus]MBE7187633.1 NADP-dependent oxidoreductase [Jatrophihabitans endophyticus]